MIIDFTNLAVEVNNAYYQPTVVIPVQHDQYFHPGLYFQWVLNQYSVIAIFSEMRQNDLERNVQNTERSLWNSDIHVDKFRATSLNSGFFLFVW